MWSGSRRIFAHEARADNAMLARVPLAVHHLAIVTEHLDRLERFYAGVLGLPVLRRWDDDAGRPRSVWLELGGGAFLAIERAPEQTRETGQPGAGAHAARSPGGAPAPGWHCVALGIARDERERWRARLGEAGHPVERETSFTIYARDPDDNLVALSHHPDPVA